MVVNDEFGSCRGSWASSPAAKSTWTPFVVGNARCRQVPCRPDVSDRKQAEWAVDSLQRLHDIIQVGWWTRAARKPTPW
jgi:hypothetical protein